MTSGNSQDAQNAASEQETFLLRITGKGVTVKRRIPGWLAAIIVRTLARYADA